MISVGIDVAKRTHEACFMDVEGQEVDRPLRFPNAAADALDFLTTLRLATLKNTAGDALIALAGSSPHVTIGAADKTTRILNRASIGPAGIHSLAHAQIGDDTPAGGASQTAVGLLVNMGGPVAVWQIVSFAP